MGKLQKKRAAALDRSRIPPTLLPRRRSPRDRHPFVYLAALSLIFSLIGFFGRFGVVYVAGGALVAVVLATAAILSVLRAR
jgi:hypothetical protein